MNNSGFADVLFPGVCQINVQDRIDRKRRRADAQEAAHTYILRRSGLFKFISARIRAPQL